MPEHQFLATIAWNLQREEYFKQNQIKYTLGANNTQKVIYFGVHSWDDLWDMAEEHGRNAAKGHYKK